MKIALFTFYLSHGAFAHGYAALAKGLCNIGFHDIYVIYLNEGPGESIKFPECATLVSLDVRRTLWSSIALAKFIRDVKPDVIITMPAFINISAILGWMLANQPETKLLISERATMSYKVFVESRGEFRWRLLPTLARIFYPKASGIVANSENVLEDLITNLRVPIQKERSCVIPPAIDTQAVTTLSQQEIDHPWFNNKDIPVIVSAGRLEQQKNYPLLLQAFKLVYEKLEARLLILGEGNQRSNLEKMIGELGLKNVCLPGYLDNPWSSIVRADVFVLPSEEEAFGRVLVEAMSCEVPVIATNAIGGGPDYILGNGKYGRLVPRGEPDSLAEAIIELLTSNDQRDKLRVTGKLRSKAFEPENVAQQWLDFIKTIGGK